MHLDFNLEHFAEGSNQFGQSAKKQPFRLTSIGEHAKEDVRVVNGERVFQLYSPVSDKPSAETYKVKVVDPDRLLQCVGRPAIDVSIPKNYSEDSIIVAGSGLSGKPILASGKFCGLEDFRSEKFNDLFNDSDEPITEESFPSKLLPKADCKIKFADREYRLHLKATGIKLFGDQQRVFRTTLTISQGTSQRVLKTEGAITLNWAGDLNGDGELDLLIQDEDGWKLHISKPKKEKTEEDSLNFEIRASYGTMIC